MHRSEPQKNITNFHWALVVPRSGKENPALLHLIEATSSVLGASAASSISITGLTGGAGHGEEGT